MKTRLIFVLTLAVAPTFGQALCGSSGLTLTTSPPRLGDPWSLAISGSPNAPGVLGFDLAPGPVAAPFGTVCLGLTPAFQLSPISMDAFGGYTTSGFLPANPALNGFGVYIQAAVADPVQPSGVALSNSVHAVLRAPRLFFIDHGIAGSTPGRWVAYDALSDVAGPIVQVPGAIMKAAAIPTLGWLAMVLSDGTLIAYDAISGSVMLSIPLTTAGSDVPALVASGSTLVIVDGGWFGPSLLHFIQLPFTSPPVTVTPPLPCYALVAPPGSPNVYATASGSDLVFPYHAGSATALQPISLGSGSPSSVGIDSVVHGNKIYFLLNSGGSSSCALNAIDTTTNTALLPAPVPVPFYALFTSDPLFRYGPGASGPALFLRDNTSTSPALVEISPQTLAVTSAPIPIPVGVYDLALSNGGTDWFLASCLTCGAGGTTGGFPPTQTLYRMDPATHAVTKVGSLPNGGWSRVSVLPSGSVNKAYVSTGGGVVRFNTDPTTSIIPVSLPLPPVPWFGLTVVID